MILWVRKSEGEGTGNPLFVFARRNALLFFEHAAEVVDGLKAGVLGNLGDGELRKAQQLPGPGQTAVPYVLNSGLMERLLKKAVELACIYAAGFTQYVRG